MAISGNLGQSMASLGSLGQSRVSSRAELVHREGLRRQRRQRARSDASHAPPDLRNPSLAAGGPSRTLPRPFHGRPDLREELLAAARLLEHQHVEVRRVVRDAYLGCSRVLSGALRYSRVLSSRR